VFAAVASTGKYWAGAGCRFQQWRNLITSGKINEEKTFKMLANAYNAHPGVMLLV
jgi:hypothetical protein